MPTAPRWLSNCRINVADYPIEVIFYISSNKRPSELVRSYQISASSLTYAAFKKLIQLSESKYGLFFLSFEFSCSRISQLFWTVSVIVLRISNPPFSYGCLSLSTHVRFGLSYLFFICVLDQLMFNLLLNVLVTNA